MFYKQKKGKDIVMKKLVFAALLITFACTPVLFCARTRTTSTKRPRSTKTIVTKTSTKTPINRQKPKRSPQSNLGTPSRRR